MKTITRFVFKNRREIITVLLLFFVSMGLRTLYQNETVVEHPLRADAAKYFSAAFNLHFFGIHSIDRPGRELPKSRTDLSPGYPLFLALWMDDGVRRDYLSFVKKILTIQAVLGATTVVLTYLLARMGLSYSWALLPALLTAINPHLIALDGFMLTESLFTFLIMLGTLLLALSWKTERYAWSFVASIVLMLSARVRAVSFLLILFLAPVFLFTYQQRSYTQRTVWLKQFAALVCGVIVILFAHREFVSRTVTQVQASSKAVSPGKQAEKQKHEVPSKYVDIKSPWHYLSNSVHPPEFFVKGESHILLKNRNPRWNNRAIGGFSKYPVEYLQWNLGAKLYYLWHWDNTYNGDVNIYPVRRSGFESQPLLRAIHQAAYAAHLPLFLLSLMAPLLLGLQWWQKSLPLKARALLLPVLGFIYFLTTLYILSWLPRYTIPFRPYSFILAAYTLSWLTALCQRAMGKGLSTADKY